MQPLLCQPVWWPCALALIGISLGLCRWSGRWKSRLACSEDWRPAGETVLGSGLALLHFRLKNQIAVLKSPCWLLYFLRCRSLAPKP